MAQTITCEFSVEGMHCDSCELYMEETLKKRAGVHQVTAKSGTQKVRMLLDETVSVDELKIQVNKEIAGKGYKIVNTLQTQVPQSKKLWLSFALATGIFTLFLLLQKLNITSWFSNETLSFPTIFILGVLASLSTCMVVVGGISMTLSSKFAAEKKTQSIIVFQLSRLIGFIVLGAVVGFLGRVVIVNAFVSGLLRVLVALVMIPVGAELIGLKLPRLVFPKQIAKAFGLFDDKDGWSSAVLLGVGTFFLPCAFTQSMQLYAMSTGSLIQGGLIMGVFALGTLPVLSLVSLGSAAGVTKMNKGTFGYTMGFLIILFAILNIVSALGTFGLLPVIQL